MEQINLVAFGNTRITKEIDKKNVPNSIEKEIENFIAECKEYSQNFEKSVCNFEEIPRNEHISIIYEVMAEKLEKIIE